MEEWFLALIAGLFIFNGLVKHNFDEAMIVAVVSTIFFCYIYTRG